jgi:hypothetical protein
MNRAAIIMGAGLAMKRNTLEPGYAARPTHPNAQTIRSIGRFPGGIAMMLSIALTLPAGTMLVADKRLSGDGSNA